MTRMVNVRLTVNGKACEGRCEPRMLLADFLATIFPLPGLTSDANMAPAARARSSWTAIR